MTNGALHIEPLYLLYLYLMPSWTVEDKKKLEKELSSILKVEKKGKKKKTTKTTTKKLKTTKKKAKVQKEAEWMFAVCYQQITCQQ